jgi:hypothetical protein
MISKSVNNIGYEGMAVIKLPSSYQKFKIKNSGTVNLGNLFTNALINNIDKKDCPSFFDLQYKTTFEIPWKSLLYNISPFTGITVGNNVDYTSKDTDVIGKVQFTTTIDSGNYNKSILPQSDIKFVMYDNHDTKNILAEILIQTGTDNYSYIKNMISSLGTGQDVIINWIMLIHNS